MPRSEYLLLRNLMYEGKLSPHYKCMWLKVHLNHIKASDQGWIDSLYKGILR